MPSDAKRGSVTMLFGEDEAIARAAYEQAVRFAGAVPKSGRALDRRMYRVTSRVRPRGKARTKQAREDRGEPVIGRPRNPLNVLVEEWGLEGKNAYTKRVPPWVFRLPRDQVILFLSRLWGTDGHVYAPLKHACEVGYTTASKGLAQDIQQLLLRIGCLAGIQHKSVLYEGERRTYYCVRMRDQETVFRFCSTVRLLDKGAAQDRALARCAMYRPRSGQRWTEITSITPEGEGEYFDLEVPGPQHYVGPGGIVSHNSGKDHICRVASLRIAYLLLCLKNPQTYFGMPEQDTIHMLNVATSAPQAQQAFFTPMTRAVKSGWFADKCEPKMNSIVFAKNVEAISGHSDAESQEGLNLILGIADEIDAFRSKEELMRFRSKQIREPQRSAEHILKMIRTSGRTRFPQTFKNVRISYPRYLGSTILRLADIAREDIEKRGDVSHHYLSGPLATWDVNPRVPNRSYFQDDYDEDPDMARAMYECAPSRATDTYFRNPDAIRAAITADRQPIDVTYRLARFKSEVTGTTTESWEPEYHFAPDFLPILGARYCLHGDLAVTGDRAGLAMSHVSRWVSTDDSVTDEHGKVESLSYDKPVVKTDFVISYSAQLRDSPPREIQIRWARLLAFDLIKRGFNIVSFTYDGFQSVDSQQILNSHGVQSSRVSMDLNDENWKTWRDVLYEGRYEMPYSALLMDELLALSRFPGGKVDHVPGGSKDEADAVCGSVVGALIAGGAEDASGKIATFQFSSSQISLIPSEFGPLVGFDGWDDVTVDTLMGG